MTMTTESRNSGRQGHARPVSEFYAELGRRLRDAREARRYSLSDVRTLSGGRWHEAAISSYERAQRRVGLEDLRDLAAFYEVPLWLLHPEGDPDPSSMLRQIGLTSALRDVLKQIEALKGDVA